jgi:hypothetical protein
MRTALDWIRSRKERGLARHIHDQCGQPACRIARNVNDSLGGGGLGGGLGGGVAAGGMKEVKEAREREMRRRMSSVSSTWELRDVSGWLDHAKIVFQRTVDRGLLGGQEGQEKGESGGGSGGDTGGGASMCDLDGILGALAEDPVTIPLLGVTAALPGDELYTLSRYWGGEDEGEEGGGSLRWRFH